MELVDLEMKLEDLKRRKFMNDMVDRWGSEEYKFDDEIRKEISETEQRIRALRGAE